MPHSLRAKLSGLHYKGILEDKDYKRLCHALDLEKAEQEPIPTTNNNEPITIIYPTIVCDDAISREDALMCLTGMFKLNKNYNPEELIALFSKRIKALPSVTQLSAKDYLDMADKKAKKIKDALTVGVLEQIKAEIKTEMRDYDGDDDFAMGVRYGFRYANTIIDKHTK